MIPFPSTYFAIIELMYVLLILAFASFFFLVVLTGVRLWWGISPLLHGLIFVSAAIFVLSAASYQWIRYVNNTIPKTAEYRAKAAMDFEQDLGLLISQMVETRVEEVRGGFWGPLKEPVRSEQQVHRDLRSYTRTYHDMVIIGGVFAEQTNIDFTLSLGSQTATYLNGATISLRPSSTGKLSSLDISTKSQTTLDDVVSAIEEACRFICDLGWKSACDDSLDWRSHLIKRLAEGPTKRLAFYVLRKTEVEGFSAYIYWKNWDDESLRASLQIEIKNLSAPTQ